MTRVPPGGTAYFDADPDEDTIEMVLTPADVRLLAQAAEEQQRAASVADATPPAPPPTTDSILPSMPSQTTSTHSSASLARGALAGVAGALVIVVAIASVSAARLTTAMKPSPPPPETPKLVATAAATPPAATPEPPQPAVAEVQPLRFRNPFDKSEVFEFPAGTTLEEARASVADLLRQRAQDRHIRPGLQHFHVNGGRAVSGGSATRRSAKQAGIAQTAERG